MVYFLQVCCCSPKIKKKGHRAKMIKFSPSFLLISNKKAIILKLPQSVRGVWAGMLGSLGKQNFCLGGRRPFLASLVAALVIFPSGRMVLWVKDNQLHFFYVIILRTLLCEHEAYFCQYLRAIINNYEQSQPHHDENTVIQIRELVQRTCNVGVRRFLIGWGRQITNHIH